MEKWTHNGHEFDFDPMDYEDAVRYEAAVKRFQESSDALDEHAPLGESILKGCEIYKAFFDSMFGEGTYKSLFGEKKNIRACDEAFISLVSYVRAAGDAIFDQRVKFMGKYAPRAEADSKQKAARKSRAKG